jgi:hypothetical protein
MQDLNDRIIILVLRFFLNLFPDSKYSIQVHIMELLVIIKYHN